MATFDYPYENRNMLFLIAFDAAEGSTEIKSLAVNTFPGSGDYLPRDEESTAEAGSEPETDEAVAASEWYSPMIMDDLKPSTWESLLAHSTHQA